MNIATVSSMILTALNKPGYPVHSPFLSLQYQAVLVPARTKLFQCFLQNSARQAGLRFCSVADQDPGSGALLTPESEMRIRSRDGKKSGSGSGMNIPDHFYKSLKTVIGFKYLKSLMRIRNLFFPGSGMEKFGSGINIPDPQHCKIVRGKRALNQIPFQIFSEREFTPEFTELNLCFSLSKAKMMKRLPYHRED
jgi:hypothetical protein